MPYAAFKWLEKSLSSCTTTTKIGGTHALIYDKGEMEDVLTALKKGVTDARVRYRIRCMLVRAGEGGGGGVYFVVLPCF